MAASPVFTIEYPDVKGTPEKATPVVAVKLNAGRSLSNPVSVREIVEKLLKVVTDVPFSTLGRIKGLFCTGVSDKPLPRVKFEICNRPLNVVLLILTNPSPMPSVNVSRESSLKTASPIFVVTELFPVIETLLNEEIP